jgi:MFS transporter, DHA2 family, multidrug resistance protein
VAAPVNKWIVAFTVMIPTLMVIVDTSVVNVSLDHIRGSLSAGIDESTWSITSYLAANAVIIPMAGWLSRVFGRKRYLIFSVILFTASSLLCGLAWNIQSLVFFRILQGIGGGGLQPTSQAILLETFPPHQHGTANAVYGVGIMFGPIIGPLLGGWITDNWSWHWVFFINVPIGILSVLMSFFFIVDPSYMKGGRIKVDYWGLVLLALGIGGLQMVLDQGEREAWFASSFVIWMAVISAFSLIFFIFVEWYAEHPILDLRAFKNTTFTLGNLVLFFALINLFGSLVLPPIYVQTLMGYTATLSGMVIAPGGLVSLCTMPIVGRLTATANPKILVTVGIVVTALSAHFMSQFNLLADFISILWPRTIIGIGMPFIIIPLTTLTLSSVRKEEMGNATSIFNLMRNLGGSIGVAYVTTMLTRRAQFHHARLAEHMTPFDLPYRLGSQQASQALHYGGVPESLAQLGGPGTIYEQLNREATMMAFNDIYHYLSIMLLLTVLLVIFMKRVKFSPAEHR